ncbi:MAG: hypothetical protein KatS3mg104_1972 [Phycisphaerae bacterium]|jgi:hypothetical protein|nr:MAG: hypothetical protein KatS3mg104_1972 [Phycisphaerae bacterium]
MIWNKERIIAELKALYKKKVDLSYNNLAKKRQALVSAAAYHFKSYRNAVEKAGINYEEIVRRPRWNKQKVIAIIKSAKKKGWDLNWSSVTKRRDDLGKAAFAAIQGRLFGSWDRALTAAGLDADEVSRYRRWSKNTIVFELKARAADGENLNSGAVQQEDPGLHAAALRYFGSYDKALRAARINPNKIRKRKTHRE